ncbi:hypothetical protein LWI28_028398 [Acer negundo]|uniref:Uncharacterized protein n=1 Tax=Acer negundo TaxID=4023 RepID=A0AAD5IB13_ACENE|nr:hypothetical protein LWI28_028398 [Acer negundo]
MEISMEKDPPPPRRGEAQLEMLKAVPKRRPCVGTLKDLVLSDLLLVRVSLDFKNAKKNGLVKRTSDSKTKSKRVSKDNKVEDKVENKAVNSCWPVKPTLFLFAALHSTFDRHISLHYMTVLGSRSQAEEKSISFCVWSKNELIFYCRWIHKVSFSRRLLSFTGGERGIRSF